MRHMCRWGIGSICTPPFGFARCCQRGASLCGGQECSIQLNDVFNITEDFSFCISKSTSHWTSLTRVLVSWSGFLVNFGMVDDSLSSSFTMKMVQVWLGVVSDVEAADITFGTNLTRQQCFHVVIDIE